MTRFKIPTKHDKPTDDAILLGHDEIVKALKNFLLSDDIITPLSIAIDGDWGSGKTSIMRTLSKEFTSDEFIKINFEPWRYENSDPPLALIQTIVKELQRNSVQKIGKQILYLAAGALSTKYLGVDIKDVAQFIEGNVRDVESFSKELEKTIKENRSGNQKLLIMIDDLDRCSVENTLLILAIMKLFLDIEDCICVAAVDFERLQQAWRTKYHVSEVKDKGKEYLEKIFQVKVAVPKPSDDQIKDYVEELVPDMDEVILELFSKIGPKNPRSIKRLLNIMRFRSSMMNSDFKNDTSMFWTLLEHAISNKALVQATRGLEKQNGSLGQLICNFAEANPSEYRDALLRHVSNTQNIPGISEKIILFLTLANKYSIKYGMHYTHFDNNFSILRNLTNEEIE